LPYVLKFIHSSALNIAFLQLRLFLTALQATLLVFDIRTSQVHVRFSYETILLLGTSVGILLFGFVGVEFTITFACTGFLFVFALTPG